MKKTKAILAVIALLVILAAVGGSIAYFTDKAEGDNVFTMGKVSISLAEPNWDPAADHQFMADKTYEKDPTVTNIGKTDAYVRLHVVVSDYSAFRKANPGFSCWSMFGGVGSKWKLIGSPVRDTSTDTVEFVCVYTEVLPASEKTQPAFWTVTIPDFVDSNLIKNIGASFEVTVFADAIQADGFEDYEEAFKAFDEQNNG